MSSMATSCDHTDHVRTQAVYALVVGGLSIILGSLPVGLGWFPQWVSLILAIPSIIAILYFVGKPVHFQIEEQFSIEYHQNNIENDEKQWPLLAHSENKVNYLALEDCAFLYNTKLWGSCYSVHCL